MVEICYVGWSFVLGSKFYEFVLYGLILICMGFYYLEYKKKNIMYLEKKYKIIFVYFYFIFVKMFCKKNYEFVRI